MNFKNTDVWGFRHAIRGMRNPLNSWDKSDSYFKNSYDFKIGERDLSLAQKLIAAGSEQRKFLRQIFVSVDITAPLYWIHEFDTYKVGVVRNSCSMQHKGASRPFNIRDFTIEDERVYDILAPIKLQGNDVANLEWVTRSENEKNKCAIGLVNPKDLSTLYKKYKNSLKCDCIMKNNIKKDYSNGMSQMEVDTKYDISQSQANAIISGQDRNENTDLFELCYVYEKMLNTLNDLRDAYIETKDYKYFRELRQLIPMGYNYKFTVTMNYENIYAMVHQRINHRLKEWSNCQPQGIYSFISWAKQLPYSKELIFF